MLVERTEVNIGSVFVRFVTERRSEMHVESKGKKTQMLSHTNMGQVSMLGRQRCTKYCLKVLKTAAFLQKTVQRWWEVVGPILSTMKVLVLGLYMFNPRLEISGRTKEELENCTEECIRIAWKEEELDRWMGKQAVSCLRRGDITRTD